MYKTIATSRPSQVSYLKQPYPVTCLLLTIGKCLWSAFFGSLPRHVVWINFQGSQCPLLFSWHKLCVLSHHPVTSSPNSTLDGNFTLGKYGWAMLPEDLNTWLLRPGWVSALDLVPGLLDLWRCFYWASSLVLGMAYGLGLAIEAVNPLAQSSLKMGIWFKPGILQTVMLLKHSKSSLTFLVTLQLARAMGLILGKERKRKWYRSLLGWSSEKPMPNSIVMLQ